MTLNSLTLGRGHHGTYPGASIGNASIVSCACSHARWYAVRMSARDSRSVTDM